MTQFHPTTPKSEVKEKVNVVQETADSNSCCSKTKQETCCETRCKIGMLRHNLRYSNWHLRLSIILIELPGGCS